MQKQPSRKRSSIQNKTSQKHPHKAPKDISGNKGEQTRPKEIGDEDNNNNNSNNHSNNNNNINSNSNSNSNNNNNNNYYYYYYYYYYYFCFVDALAQWCGGY